MWGFDGFGSNTQVVFILCIVSVQLYIELMHLVVIT